MGMSTLALDTYTSDALPLTPPDVTIFTNAGSPVFYTRITNAAGLWVDIFAKPTSITAVPPDPVPAPEPTSAVLVLSGLAFLARRGHARVRAMRWE
jgi:hypothetical protein